MNNMVATCIMKENQLELNLVNSLSGQKVEY